MKRSNSTGFGEIIQEARKQENRKTGKPDEASEKEVNLSIKVAKFRRQHWAAEAKRQGTTLTAAITEALSKRFGEPE